MNFQGTGLGLSICKRMLEKMGGTVQVTSNEGIGTTFTIEISTKAKVLSKKKRVAKESSRLLKRS